MISGVYHAKQNALGLNLNKLLWADTTLSLVLDKPSCKGENAKQNGQISENSTDLENNLCSEFFN